MRRSLRSATAVFLVALGLAADAAVPAYASGLNYSQIIQSAAASVAASQYDATDTADGCGAGSRALGAIAANPPIPGGGHQGYVDPYQASYGAFALVLAGGSTYLADAFSYIKWYLSNINWPASADTYQGVAGTIFDYKVNDGNCTETSNGTYDSSDAYAGVFLSLVNAFVEADPGEASYFTQSGPAYDLGVAANAIIATLNSDQLTSALKSATPGGDVYTEDNIEAAQGLADYHSLLVSEGDNDTYWSGVASNMRNAIQNDLFYVPADAYEGGLGDTGSAASSPCSNAMYQLWPVYDLQNTASWRASVISAYNTDYPQWTDSTPDGSNAECPAHDPEGYMAYAAAQTGDYTDVNTWLNNVTNTTWGPAGYPYPWTVQVWGWEALAAYITWRQMPYVILRQLTLAAAAPARWSSSRSRSGRPRPGGGAWPRRGGGGRRRSRR